MRIDIVTIFPKMVQGPLEEGIVARAIAKGLLEVVVDPRTTFAQCLAAALLAELADNDAWENLVELAKQNGEETLTSLFASAAEEEGEHLENVRTWVAAALGSPE